MMVKDKQGRIVGGGYCVGLKLAVLAFWWPQQSVITARLWKASRSDSRWGRFPYRAEFKGLKD